MEEVVAHSILVEIRCPTGPKQLLMKLRQDGERPHVDRNNLMELHCRDCTKNARQINPDVKRIVHCFDFAGSLVRSIAETR